MATLTGQSIASSYEQLLSLPDGGGNSTTLVAVTDGDAGTTFALKVATTSISVGATNKIYLDGGGNTYLHEVSDDAVQIVSGGTDVITIEGGEVKGRGSNCFKITTGNTPTATAPNIFPRASDTDTGIGHGGSADSNTLNLITGGASRLIVDNNSRISLSNNDSGGTGGLDSLSGNTVFGYLAGQSIEDGCVDNVFIGHTVASATLNDATKNVGIGADALAALTQGDDNIALGYGALKTLTTGLENIAIGTGTNDATTAIHHTVCIGHNAGTSINATTSNGTVAIGYEAFKNLTASGEAESPNIAIGKNAGYYVVTGHSSIYIGFGAGFKAGATNSDGNVVIGHLAMAGGSDTKTGNDMRDSVIVGAYAGGGLGSTDSYGDNQTVVSGYRNCFIGFKAAASIAGEVHSTVAIGYHAGLEITSGDNNVIIGSLAGDAITTGTSNTIVGTNALDAAAHGESYNIAVGVGALGGAKENVPGSGSNAHTVDHNIAIGLDALYGGDLGTGTGTITHTGNIAIGNYALDATGANAHTGTVAIGHLSLTKITTGDGNTAVGYNTMSQEVLGTHSVALGYESLKALTGGIGNVAIGYQAMGVMDDTANTLSNCVAIGKWAFKGNNSTTTDASDGTVVIGTSAGTAITAGTHGTADANDKQPNTLIGNTAGTALTVGDGNVAVGANALDAEVTGHKATAVGFNALTAQVNGSDVDTYNTAVGYRAGLALVDSLRNTAIGGDALITDCGNDNTAVGYEAGNLLTGISNTIIGSYTGDNATTLESAVIIGAQAGRGVLTNDANGTVLIGQQAGQAITSGAGNVAVGYKALLTEDTGDFNTAVGYESLKLQNLDGTVGNTALGYRSGYAINTGYLNTILGHEAGYSQDAAANCVYIGAEAAKFADSSGNVAVGVQAFGGYGSYGTPSDNTGANNTAIGYQSMKGATAALTGANNVAIGKDAGKILQGAGASNTLVGSGCGAAMTTAQNNTFVGYACGDAVSTVGSQTALGYNALGNGAGGDGVTAIGDGALSVCAGDANIGLGHNAGNTITSGTGNVIIGHNADVTTNSHVNQIAIGNAVVTDASDQLRIGDAANYLAFDFSSGGGTIAVTSDKRIKKDIKDTDLGIDFINELRPVKFTPKNEFDYPDEFGVDKSGERPSDPDKRQDGLIAQEVKDVMDGMGVTFSGWNEDENTRQNLEYSKFVTPLIKAVQQLSKKVEELEAKLSE